MPCDLHWSALALVKITGPPPAISLICFAISQPLSEPFKLTSVTSAL